MAQAGAIAGVAGGMMQANSIMDDAFSQKAVNEYNAKIDEQNAKLTLLQAKEDERKARIYSRKVIGEAQANYGASGVTLEGSPADVLQESAAAAELDALSIRHAGYAKAIAYKQSALLERYAGNRAVSSARTKAATALLGGGVKAAGAL